MYLTTNMLEDWSLYGSEVIAFAPTPTRGVSKDVIEQYKRVKIEVSCDHRLTVRRFPMIQEKKNTFLRAFRYVWLSLAFLHYGLHTKADVMFIDSTPPIQGLVATIIKRIKGIPYVYDLQDIFPDSLVNTGLCTEKSIFYKIGRIVERITYKNADHIIAISEDFRKNIMEKGVPEEKISVIYNWVDENKVHYISREQNTLFDEYGIDRDKFYIAYAGNIGYTQNMDLLLDVADRLSGDPDIGFILVGDGAYMETVKKRINEQGLTNIALLPFQPYERISEVFSLGDVGLIISKSGIGNNSVPSKTWSYMAAGRPILASFDLHSELCELIRNHNCGVCVEPDNADLMIGAIEEMKKTDSGISGRNGRNFIQQNLTREVGTKRYYKVLQAASHR